MKVTKPGAKPIDEIIKAEGTAEKKEEAVATTGKKGEQ